MEAPPPVKLLLVGDVMLGRLVNEQLRDEPPEYPWGDTLPLFHQADWRACNLECVITDHGSPWVRSPKVFHFQSDARNLAVLRVARIDAVSLANNHVLDFNHRGLVEMLKLLDGAHVAHSGAGLNSEEASRAAISKVKGLRIGFLSFTDNEPEWEAGVGRPGVYHVPVDAPDRRTEELLAKVRAAKARVDLLIVAAHWGGNWGCRPPASHVTLARDLVRAGSDVIFGHSAHVCRGIEVVDHGLVLYSAGDFVDDYAVDAVERNDRSWAFEVCVENGRVSSLDLHPTVIRDCQARIAARGEAQVMIAGMRELCAEFGTEITVPASHDRAVIRLQSQAG